MRLRNIDLILVVAVALANILWALFPSHLPVIGIVLALPLVFLSPGYVLAEILFPRHHFDGVYRFAIILGLSLSIDIINAFILNVFTVGLRASSWAISLGLLTGAFSLLVVYLRRGSSTSEMRLPKLGLRIHEYVLLGLSIGVAILAIGYSVISTTYQPHSDLTQLWMLPSSQTGNNCAVRLGVHNFETEPQTYRITMAVNGIQANTWTSVVLAPQEEWERLVPLSPQSPGSVYVEVKLYKFDQPGMVYREGHVTLNVVAGGTDQKMHC
jgi:uncharacterized membrane protein